MVKGLFLPICGIRREKGGIPVPLAIRRCCGRYEIVVNMVTVPAWLATFCCAELIVYNRSDLFRTEIPTIASDGDC